MTRRRENVVARHRLRVGVLLGLGVLMFGAVAVQRAPVAAQAQAPREPFGMAENFIPGPVEPAQNEIGNVVEIPNLWEEGLVDGAGADHAETDLAVEALENDAYLAETAFEETSFEEATAGAEIEISAQLGVPQLVAPLTGARVTGVAAPPTGMPTLAWAAVPGAERYEVQVSASPGFAATLVSRETYALSYTHVDSLPDGTYYWRVRAGEGRRSWGDYSEIWSFTKDWSNNQELRPFLLAPAQDSQLAGFDHDHFSWEPVPGAASYLLEIASDNQFNQIAYSDTTIKTHHTPTQRLGNSPYYWRVFPLDNQGNRGASSEIGRFTFLWDAPPSLLAPEDDYQTPFVPQFSWSPVEGARRYQLEISTQNDLSNATTYLTANTDFTPEKALSNDQDYYWRVRAIDANNVGTRYSEIRRFSMRWNFQPQLLTPANNAIMLSYPYFSWTPVPEAEQYQIQIANNNAFDRTIGDVRIYNVTSYTQPSWRDVAMMSDVYWRVRAIDAERNNGPWSDVYSFQLNMVAGPNLIYPHRYYEPDVDHLPVHEDRTIAWPVFLWDSAYNHPMPEGEMLPARNRPDYYRLTVSETPDFSVVNFEMETAGLAVAPTLETPFTGLEDGKLYYWRVRAMREGMQLGVDTVWPTRYAADANAYEVVDEMRVMHPVSGKEAVEIAPVLGWLPVADAHHYRIQLSQDRAFTEIVEEARPQFIYYAPWQDRHEEIPHGTYWWRVRAENEADEGLTEWSEVRYFNVSQEAVMGNPYDFEVPETGLFTSTESYNPDLTRLAANLNAPGEPDFALGALHMMPDRSHKLPGQSTANYTWITGFEVAPMISETVQYGIYIDANRDEAMGATVDPLGKPIEVDPLYRPDFAIYVTRTPDNEFTTIYYQWQGANWTPGVAVEQMGGAVWFDSESSALHVRMPYSSLGSTADQFVGSLAVVVFSTLPGDETGIIAAVPTQPGAAITRPALLSDMLMPLYPFNTPLWNPQVHYEVPTLRWRMPYFNSVDGYEVQVALDDRFTQIVETWETYETGTSSYFALLPTAYQSRNAHGDNESYFWRVRMRYERHTSRSSDFERSSWSRPMRYKLTSYTVGNPIARSNARIDESVDEGAVETTTLSRAGSEGLIVNTSPTFSWERVEGAAGYRLWVSQDANFGTRIIDKRLDTVSYTPQDALPDGTYYWMVAPRRSNNVFGQWSPVYTFDIESIAPSPLAPLDDEVINDHPTFRWMPLYIDEPSLRLATPRYRLQISDEINFSNPNTFDTQATSFTLSNGNSLRRVKMTDGTWYWRVAAIDANGNVGAYSEIQQFRKEYLRPELISPSQGANEPETSDTVGGIPSFVWSPVAGAAYYEVSIANTPQELENVRAVRTDNTRYTPVTNLTETDFYWRVQMFDSDGVGGPTVDGWAIVPKEENLPDIFIPFATKR